MALDFSTWPQHCWGSTEGTNLLAASALLVTSPLFFYLVPQNLEIMHGDFFSIQFVKLQVSQGLNSKLLAKLPQGCLYPRVYSPKHVTFSFLGNQDKMVPRGSSPSVCRWHCEKSQSRRRSHAMWETLDGLVNSPILGNNDTTDFPGYRKTLTIDGLLKLQSDMKIQWVRIFMRLGF